MREVQTHKVRREATGELLKVHNAYQALMPYLAKFDLELQTKGRLSEESQVLLRECVRSLHKVDRVAERLYR